MDVDGDWNLCLVGRLFHLCFRGNTGTPYSKTTQQQSQNRGGSVGCTAPAFCLEFEYEKMASTCCIFQVSLKIFPVRLLECQHAVPLVDVGFLGMIPAGIRSQLEQCWNTVLQGC